MKKILLSTIILTVGLNIIACNNAGSVALSEKNKTENVKIKITVGSIVLNATMYDNATTRSFIAKLPITLPMMDLYSREMVYRFPESLPAEEVSTRGYNIGEIIYYPPLHSFVIMYAQNGEVFSMQSMGYVDSNVQVLDGMGNKDVTFELNEPTGIEQIKDKHTYKIYPNPADEYLEISGQIRNVHITNLNGQEIFKSQKNRIDIRELKSGPYLLKIEFNDNKLITEKFVKR